MLNKRMTILNKIYLYDLLFRLYGDVNVKIFKIKPVGDYDIIFEGVLRSIFEGISLDDMKQYEVRSLRVVDNVLHIEVYKM